jgi:tetratricopeptide (TPR) repeat protein
MAEARRLESSSSPDTVDRASQADALLVQGLDRYFAGRFEEAVHIWTRVLFLDRSHARARAYIDRARSALAERQRQSEEMIQASQQLLDGGHTDAARDLLTEAVASSGDDERASALRLKLERIERARPVPGALTISAAFDVVPAWSWPRRSRRTGALAAIVAALFVTIAWGGLRGWGAAAVDDHLPSPVTPAPLQVLSSSEVGLIRARTLFSRGRLAQALQALDRVDDASPVRAEAEALRIEIQRLLLASVQGRAAPAHK